MEKTELKRTKNFDLPSGVLAAAVSPNGARVVVGCMHGVYLLDLDSGDHDRLYQHESYASSVAWSGDNAVVSAGYDGAVCWFDIEKRMVMRRQQLHQFWSWDMALSPDGTRLASVTGQYLAGGYKYEPRAEQEPCIRVLSAETGALIWSLPHVPSVQAVAISPDSRFVAAGNLMGEVRVFDMNDGELASKWTTSDFTSWGIIKSHCYLGGIFSMRFSPTGDHLLLAGMGPMRDPMAGNGKQLWQRWDWKGEKASLLDQTHEGQAGEGLMETLAVHPDASHFLMGGRLRGGDWNAALFDHETGDRVASLKTGYRVTDAEYLGDGKQLLLAGTKGQPKKKKDGRFNDFGRIEIYAC